MVLRWTFSKKDGGVRPIVIGYRPTLRRLAAKVVNNIAVDKLTPLLAPNQVGVGVAHGMEAAVHATRTYVQQLPPDSAVVKLDFRNAFNSVRRDVMLDAVRASLPEAYHFIHSAYSSTSHLLYGDDVVQSNEGVHQGDPLGPLCLAIHPLLANCAAELRIGYLDDITLGGDTTELAQAVDTLRCEAAKMGLFLNENKCELMRASSPSALTASHHIFANFTEVNIHDATLLGSPLSSLAATDKALEARVNDLKTAASRLQFLHAHDALVILKHSLSVPKLLHILRSSFCGNHPALLSSDEELRCCLSQTLNVTLDDAQWLQASLPVRDGGLGIRRAN